MILLGGKSKQNLKIVLTLCVSVLFLQQVLANEKGQLHVRNYSPQEYDWYSQVWSITQSHSGLMYFGTRYGVLEFDGVTWRKIKLPGYKIARTIATAPDGTIYVGGHSDIGFLENDVSGMVQYRSLLPKVPVDEQDFGRVWDIGFSEQGVWFVSKNTVLLYSKQKVRAISCEFDLNELIIVDNRVFFQSFDKGMFEYIADSLIYLKNSIGAPADQAWYSSMFSNQKYMLGYVGDGVYELDFGSLHNNTFDNPPVRMIPELDSLFEQYYTYSGIALDHNRMAINFAEYGLVVVDRNGHIEKTLTKKNGLRSDFILSMYHDREENLWLATDNGISKVYVNSPVSFWSGEKQIGTSIVDIHIHNNKFYLASFAGMFSMQGNKLEEIEGISAECNEIETFKVPGTDGRELLLAGTDVEGLCVIKGDSVSEIIKYLRLWTLYQSRLNPNILYIGLDDGLLLYDYNNGDWTNLGKLPGVENAILNIAEGDNGILWLMRENDIYKVIPSEDIQNPKEVRVIPLMLEGLFETFYDMVYYQGKLLICSTSGLFELDMHSERLSPFVGFGAQFSDGSRSVDGINALGTDTVLIWGEENGSYFATWAIKSKDGYDLEEENRFFYLPQMTIDLVMLDKDSVIWVVGTDGLFKVDPVAQQNEIASEILIRKMLARNDSVVFANDKILKKHHAVHRGISFDLNRLRFEFAAPDFFDEDKTQYSFWLEGLEEDWSAWGNKTSADYYFVYEGDYTFNVKAKNKLGKESPVASLSFTIMAPWYRSTVACILYVLLIIAIWWIIGSQRNKRLRKVNQKLAERIDKRTREIVQKNEEIQAQSDHLKQLNNDLQTQNSTIEEQRDQLKELNATKDKFFSIIAHDLKSPFQALIGFSEMLSEEFSDFSEDEVADIICMMNKSATTGFNLLENLLDWANSQTNKITCRPERIRVMELIDSVMGLQCSQAMTKNIKLHVGCPKELTIYADRHMISTTLRNLVSNAIKFSHVGGTIDVFVLEKNNFVTIQVKDNGVGMSNEHLHDLFKIDTITSTLGTSNEKGTGLGLILCKEFVEANHGTIEVQSTVGKGTVFTVELPK